MTTLKYKLVETLLRLSGKGKLIEKALNKGHISSEAPPRSLRHRWAKTVFEGRDIWTCKPYGPGSGKVYLHQHGGAYALGLIGLHYSMFTKLADMSGTTIILPDYPLPPEAAASDIIGFAVSHYEAVAAEYGADNIRIGGDSAGGNLALAMCQSLKVPHPVLLLSPWVDLDMSTMRDDIQNTEPLLEPVSLRRAGHRYAGSIDPKEPLISPMFADPKMLPEMMIFTGETDLLHVDIMAFAAKAGAAGKIRKLATYGEFGHYWMFYPTSDRESTMVELAAILTG